MDFVSVFAVAIGLAMDAFSVSISAGLIIKEPNFRHYFRLAFHFGLFQFMMPIIGYFAGAYLEDMIKDYDHWLAFGLLLIIGTKMIHDAFSKDDNELGERDPSRGGTLILLSVATSIDALAVGLSLGVLDKPVLIPSIIIGLTCLVFSVTGVFLGRRVGKILGKRAEAVGGVVLILIGIKILLEHIVA